MQLFGFVGLELCSYLHLSCAACQARADQFVVFDLCSYASSRCALFTVWSVQLFGLELCRLSASIWAVIQVQVVHYFGSDLFSIYGFDRGDLTEPASGAVLSTRRVRKGGAY